MKIFVQPRLWQPTAPAPVMGELVLCLVDGSLSVGCRVTDLAHLELLAMTAEPSCQGPGHQQHATDACKELLSVMEELHVGPFD